MAISAAKIAWRVARGAWAILLLFAYLGVHFSYPFSYYYRLGEIYVDPNPAKQGDVLLEYNGGAVREFLGSYSVVARRFSDNGIACDAAGGPLEYKPDAQRPDPLTMEWWAPSDKRCSSLDPGVYTIETCWTVIDRGWGGLLPSIRECITTPNFRVE